MRPDESPVGQQVPFTQVIGNSGKLELQMLIIRRVSQMCKRKSRKFRLLDDCIVGRHLLWAAQENCVNLILCCRILSRPRKLKGAGNFFVRQSLRGAISSQMAALRSVSSHYWFVSYYSSR